MKRIFLFIAGFLLLLPVVAATRSEEIRSDLLNPNCKRVLVASHRADWRNFPENSIAGIESAIQMGVDIVELDLQRTKDGQLILMHDKKLDRTTTGKGLIADWTLDSIRTLYLKNGCNIKTIHRVPTLEEVLAVCKGRVLINLDKADRYFDQVYELLQQTGTVRQVIMKGSKSPEEVKEMYGQYLSEVIYMPKINLDNENAETELNNYLRILNPPVIECKFANHNNPLPIRVKELTTGSCRVWYNTLWSTQAGGHDDDCSLHSTQAGYGYLIDSLGCSVIQTDRPAYLINYLTNRLFFYTNNCTMDWNYLQTENEYRAEESPNFRVVEAFLKGKHLPSDNEDGVLVTPFFAAVIDGATAKSSFRYEGKATGRLAMELILETIRHFSPDITPAEAVQSVTRAIHAFYETYGLLADVEAHPANRFTANAVIFSFARREIWQVGDCQCLAGTLYSSNEKEIDGIMARARAAYNELMLLYGETEQTLLAHDLGRDFIQPFLEKQSLLQNCSDSMQPLAFPVFDGFPVHMNQVKVFSLPADLHEIVLASDGYPHIFNNLRETEAYLAAILEKDPLCMRLYRSTKGIKSGNSSFDDRAYLRISF